MATKGISRTEAPVPAPTPSSQTSLTQKPKLASTLAPSSTRPAGTESDNPWLAAAAGPSKAPRKKNEIVVSKDSDALERAKNKLSKTRAKVGKESAGEYQGDEEVIVDADRVLGDEIKQKLKKKADDVGGQDGEEEDEVEEQERALLAKKGKGKTKAFEQRDLVALAFAGDNVVRVCYFPNLLQSITESITRTLKRRSNVKLPLMPQRRLIRRSRVGFVALPSFKQQLD